MCLFYSKGPGSWMHLQIIFKGWSTYTTGLWITLRMRNPNHVPYWNVIITDINVMYKTAVTKISKLMKEQCIVMTCKVQKLAQRRTLCTRILLENGIIAYYCTQSLRMTKSTAVMISLIYGTSNCSTISQPHSRISLSQSCFVLSKKAGRIVATIMPSFLRTCVR